MQEDLGRLQGSGQYPNLVGCEAEEFRQRRHHDCARSSPEATRLTPKDCLTVPTCPQRGHSARTTVQSGGALACSARATLTAWTNRRKASSEEEGMETGAVLEGMIAMCGSAFLVPGVRRSQIVRYAYQKSASTRITVFSTWGQ